MCGRYVLEFDHDVYLGGEPLGADIHNFNVAPTTTVPILLERFTEESSQGHPEETPLALSQLHNRLPVPLHFDGTNTDNLTLWLRSGKTLGQTNPPNSDALAIRTRKSLQTITENAYPQTSHWALHPVTTAVGNIRNNGPQLTQPTQDLLTELT